MRQWLSKVVSVVASAARSVRTEVTSSSRALMVGPAPAYRPEAHYMRGPGPKWRAKHMIRDAGNR
jgi:hypothetical protein